MTEVYDKSLFSYQEFFGSNFYIKWNNETIHVTDRFMKTNPSFIYWHNVFACIQSALGLNITGGWIDRSTLTKTRITYEEDEVPVNVNYLYNKTKILNVIGEVSLQNGEPVIDIPKNGAPHYLTNLTIEELKQNPMSH
jgi:hypothetical protein